MTLKNTPNADCRKVGKIIRYALACAFSLCAMQTVLPYTAWADYEKPPVLKAGSILKPEVLKGKHHTVADQIKNDGLFNHYTVESEFGTFKAGSTSSLWMLINEINAIAVMAKVKTHDAAIKGLEKAGENTVTGLKNLFTDPVSTLEGAVQGASSIFDTTKETISKRENSDTEDSDVEQTIGLSDAKGKIATKYGVDVYSRNQRLQEELNRLGRADYLGGLGLGVATSFVPGVGGLVLGTSGTARLLQETINTTPVSELWVRNKKKLLAMKIDEATAEGFLNNRVFSPTGKTVLVAALESLQGVADRKFFVKAGMQATDADTAEVITDIAIMSADFHKHVAPLKGFFPLANVTHASGKDGSVIVLLPTDHIIWSKEVADVLTPLADAAKNKEKQLWTLGSFSKRAQAELEKLGWKLHTRATERLSPGKKR